LHSRSRSPNVDTLGLFWEKFLEKPVWILWCVGAADRASDAQRVGVGVGEQGRRPSPPDQGRGSPPGRV